METRKINGSFSMHSLVWFRNDLRIHANPALNAVLRRNQPVLAIYILDDHAPDWQPGSASRWWLHHSLRALSDQLQTKNICLSIQQGNAKQIILKFVQDYRIDFVAWNRSYDATSIQRDKQIKQHLKDMDVEIKSYNGTLLYEPWEILKSNGKPYQVFTAYWKSLINRGIPATPPSVRFTKSNRSPPILPDNIEQLLPLPQHPNWASDFSILWKPGEQQALQSLRAFKKDNMSAYASERDHPYTQGTSMLSPNLHFGEISPQQIAAELMDGNLPGAEVVLRQLVWREFAYSLLYHFPDTSYQPLNEHFKQFTWRKTYQQDLQKWQNGQTGIPLVDAGMRQLWSTGWMHNRVRMVVASFLTKNLLIPWQEGARWFWDTLVDANLPNNTMGWQWVAGCGADAAPYFRIFNPVLQGQKFDPHGYYVRRWIPELAALPDKWIHSPWEAPEEILRAAKLQLGHQYPLPIVDLKATRQRALDRYKKLREEN